MPKPRRNYLPDTTASVESTHAQIQRIRGPRPTVTDFYKRLDEIVNDDKPYHNGWQRDRHSMPCSVYMPEHDRSIRENTLTLEMKERLRDTKPRG